MVFRLKHNKESASRIGSSCKVIINHRAVVLGGIVSRISS